jgi:3-oxoacyl-[acyl-carrier protein] reductase
VRLCLSARRKELLEQVAKDIVAAGGTPPQVEVADIMAEGAPQQLAQRALAGLGKVEILVNCAGGSRSIPVDAPEEVWIEGMTLNFTRVRQVTHALLPGMIQHKWGRIINISGKSEPEGLNVANSAKAGIHAWSKGLSREVGKHGITVNSVAPGRIMSEQIRRNYPEEFRKHQSETEIDVKRYGEPEELAYVVVMLASPLARYVTGTVIPVDGGLRRYAF